MKKKTNRVRPNQKHKQKLQKKDSLKSTKQRTPKKRFITREIDKSTVRHEHEQKEFMPLYYMHTEKGPKELTCVIVKEGM